MDSDFNTNGFSIYPNPSNGLVHLNITHQQSDNIPVEIYSAMGAMVYSTMLTAGQNGIDLSAISNGIYLVKVYNGTEVLSQKIIKQ